MNQLTPLTTPPNVTDWENFDTNADMLLSVALPRLVNEYNANITELSTIQPNVNKVVAMQDALLSVAANINNVVSAATLFTSQVQLSAVTAYHLLSGKLDVTSSVVTAGFASALDSGTGLAQLITTGIDMSTQWGGDTTKQFGGLVIRKARNSATYVTEIYDTIRGISNYLLSASTNAQANGATSLTAFNSSGFGVGVAESVSATNYISWNFQTTHRKTGTTNHSMPFTCHYNPFTGFTMVQYTGSGLAGHEIPYLLNQKFGFFLIKGTNSTYDWFASYRDNFSFCLDTAAGEAASAGHNINNGNIVLNSANAGVNAATNTYIMYGWANSFFDNTNNLIGNYETGVYQGTGTANNKINTKSKPALLIIKRLDSTGNWYIYDNLRSSGELYLNLSNAEGTSAGVAIAQNGFTTGADTTYYNAAGAQYMYFVAYDNDSGSGKSKYNRELDNPTLTLNAKVPFANGYNSNGTQNSMLTKNELVTGITLKQGTNYVAALSTGTYAVSQFAPQYNLYNGFGDYFSTDNNAWYNNISVFQDSCDSTTNWAAGNSGVLASANGELTIKMTSVNYPYAVHTQNCIIGKKYKLIWTMTGGAGIGGITAYVSVGTVSGGNDTAVKSITSSSYGELIFTASNTTQYITLTTNTNITGDLSTWDNIALFPINSDGTPDLSSATQITSRNYLDAIVYADQNCMVEYVAQLPKTRYENIIKANQYQGKNVPTLFVNIDTSTTPATVKQNNFNVAGVLKGINNLIRVYFLVPMDNVDYTYDIQYTTAESGSWQSWMMPISIVKTVNYLEFQTYIYSSSGYSGVATKDLSITIYGGKNI